MKKVQINAKIPAKDGKPEKIATITVEYPDYEVDAKKAYGEAALAYGEAAVLSNAFSNWRVTLQANVRGGLDKGESQEQIQTRLGSSKMGVAAAGIRVDPIAAFTAEFASATPEKQQQMIADLQAKAQAARGGQPQAVPGAAKK